MSNVSFRRGVYDAVVETTIAPYQYNSHYLVRNCGGTGEMWDDEQQRWSAVGKEHIKAKFRNGEIQILSGTDSMSEGLNLQTCDVMVSFDLPWNFTRVEQRIGRLDRIGGMPNIAVHNLYYRDTVEVDIYDRLRERFDSFEDVLGRSAPVLAAMEDTLLDAAMGVIGSEQAFKRIDESIRTATDAPLSLDDLDAVPEQSGELEPAMALHGLRDRLLTIGGRDEPAGGPPSAPRSVVTEPRPRRYRAHGARSGHLRP